MSRAGMHDQTGEEDEDFDSIAPDREPDERTLREGDSMPGKCGKEEGTEMRNYPLTAKEQHKRKEKLAKIRQTVMIILMVIAGLYYLTVERSQVTDAAVVTNVEESAATMLEDARQNAAGKETKFTIEGFLESTSAPNEVMDTGTEKETSIQNQTEAVIITPLTAEQAPTESYAESKVQPTANTKPTTQAVPDTIVVQAEDKRVNLNTATLEELDALPGVGPSTAKNIIAYREAHGGFAAPEEIMNVKRIGEKTFEKLKAHIRV